MLKLSEELGFKLINTESQSSSIFEKDSKVFKISRRNSFKRLQSDYDTLRTVLVQFIDHIPNSEIVASELDGEILGCVIQTKIKGKEIKYVARQEVLASLADPHTGNKLFLTTLLDYFFPAIQNRELYPDPVGYPTHPDFFNSVNCLLEESTGKIILCDVGLSPHEDTLEKNGLDFYDGENVQNYLSAMKDFQNTLDTL